MLYYTLSPDNPERMRTGTWHVGESLPSPLFAATCTEIQADEDELNFIRGRFSNIPTSNAGVVSWYGEIANFIFHNLEG